MTRRRNHQSELVSWRESPYSCRVTTCIGVEKRLLDVLEKLNKRLFPLRNHYFHRVSCPALIHVLLSARIGNTSESNRKSPTIYSWVIICPARDELRNDVAKDLKRVHRDVRIWIIKEVRERDSQYVKCALEQMLLDTTIVAGRDKKKVIWQQRTSLELNLETVCWRTTRMTNDWSSRRKTSST